MPSIVLATLNARYSHASLGLRCLRANLGALRDDSAIVEFTLRTPLQTIVEKLLAQAPRVVGFGVYIWNVTQTEAVVRRLKEVAPHVVVVLGGPEVSHEVDQQSICRVADYVVTGWGEVSFARLVQQILHGPRPLMKVHAGEQPPLAALALPYDEYSEADIAHRHLYVEASRGCPFKCEFCLSALDKTAWPFPLDTFLQSLEVLWQRGARRFKFVDRTFNLKVDTSVRILEFFLAKLRAAPDDPPFLHFELIPDHLPERLKAPIAAFPPGALQFEIGIQTFNVEVQQLVSRRQDNTRAEENLRWLRAHTHAHLHVDLIAGLPGETVESFGAGFDRLVALQPHEIQFGILKRLRGAPISRHTQAYSLQFNPAPPYNVLATDRIDAPTMLLLTRAARVWDLIANSGRFVQTLPLLLGAQPFAALLALTQVLQQRLGRLHAIALEDLSAALHDDLVQRQGVTAALAAQLLTADFTRAGASGKLAFAPAAGAAGAAGAPTDAKKHSGLPRQARHGAGAAAPSAAPRSPLPAELRAPSR
jgi:radical SAM superfamily enzyme YgiQ (UPF0313 family)